MSLDGYIAGPKGESDWIVMDPEIDFRTLVGAFDTVLMGRKSYAAILGTGLQLLDSVWPIRFSEPTQEPVDVRDREAAVRLFLRRARIEKCRDFGCISITAFL